MISRRNLFLAAPAAAYFGASKEAVAGGVTLEQLRREFEQRSESFRRMAQDGLKAEGYYTGAIDGAWGPGTAGAYEALMASPRYRRHAKRWTYSQEVQVIETLLFLNSDAYL